jgi:fatty acid desaturase
MYLDNQKIESQLHFALEPAIHVDAEAHKPKNFTFYRQAIQKNLSADVFLPNKMRLVPFFSYIALVAAAMALVVMVNPAWPIKLLCGILIGFSNGILGLLTHEIAHGSVVKNKYLKFVLAFFGMLPFLITPTFWKYSHNRLHHGKTQKLIDDPDAFPTLRIFKHSRFLQRVFPYTPGSGHKRSYAYFCFWLTFNYMVAQLYFRSRNRIYDSLNHRAVKLELAGQVAIFVTLLAITGPSAWLWVFAIPFLIQNYTVMSYIATNHNLSPLTSENNPLENSLTVTNHPILERLHINFGYHVEHHLFPNVNPKHAKLIHHELKTQFPREYKFMPKSQALRMLYSTSRIYKNSSTLMNPKTGEVYQTL